MKKLYRWFLNWMSGDALKEIDHLNKIINRLEKELSMSRAGAEASHRMMSEAMTERVEIFRRCVHLEQVNEDLNNRLAHLQRIESLERKRKHLPDTVLAGVTLGLVSTTCEASKKS